MGSYEVLFFNSKETLLGLWCSHTFVSYDAINARLINAELVMGHSNGRMQIDNGPVRTSHAGLHVKRFHGRLHRKRCRDCLQRSTHLLAGVFFVYILVQCLLGANTVPARGVRKSKRTQGKG